MEIVNSAALTFHPTTVLTEVLEWQRQRRAGGRRRAAAGRTVLKDRLVALLAPQARVTARCRCKHVVRVHRANQQRRSCPCSVAASAPHPRRRTIHASVDSTYRQYRLSLSHTESDMTHSVYNTHRNETPQRLQISTRTSPDCTVSHSTFYFSELHRHSCTESQQLMVMKCAFQRHLQHSLVICHTCSGT